MHNLATHCDCPASDHLHLADELGGAVETICLHCEQTCARRVTTGTGEQWEYLSGVVLRQAITARPPAIRHTHQLSELPCPGCHRGKAHKRRSGSRIRRAAARAVAK